MADSYVSSSASVRDDVNDSLVQTLPSALPSALPDASALFARVERQLWQEARHLWRGWKGATVDAPYGTQVVNHADAAAVVWRAALEHFPRLSDRFERTDTVTLAKNARPIERHRDNPAFPGTHKLLIYCNDADDCDVGGTRFFPAPPSSSSASQTAVDVTYGAGRVVIFDLNVEHEGLRNPSGRVKRALGLRIREKL